MYFEDLPPGCPPQNAVDTALTDVWRFHVGSSPQPEHFYSHAKLGKNNRNNVCPCLFSSCSLFEGSKARQMAKLPFFKKKMASELDIPVTSGKSLRNSHGHVDFWMYTAFDPIKHVVQTTKL